MIHKLGRFYIDAPSIRIAVKAARICERKIDRDQFKSGAPLQVMGARCRAFTIAHYEFVKVAQRLRGRS